MRPLRWLHRQRQLVANSDDLSFTPRTCVVGGQKFSPDLHMCTCTHVHIYTRMHTHSMHIQIHAIKF